MKLFVSTILLLAALCKVALVQNNAIVEDGQHDDRLLRGEMEDRLLSREAIMEDRRLREEEMEDVKNLFVSRQLSMSMDVNTKATKSPKTTKSPKDDDRRLREEEMEDVKNLFVSRQLSMSMDVNTKATKSPKTTKSPKDDDRRLREEEMEDVKKHNAIVEDGAFHKNPFISRQH